MAHKRMVRWWMGLALTLAALGLVGCGLAPVDPNFTLQGQGNTGVVYLSLTRVGSLESSMHLKLRGVGHSYSTNITLDDAKVKRDWAKVTYSASITDHGHSTVQEPIGYLAAFSLPAGDYEFYVWYGASPIWGQVGDDYVIRSEPFSVKFSVNPGAVTYAGNLQITVPNRIVADHRQGTFQISVSDQQQRDQALLKEKYPRLGEQAVRSVVMSSPNAGQSLTYWAIPVSGPTRNGDGGDHSN